VVRIGLVVEAGGTVTCELASVGAVNPISINVIVPSTSGDMTNLIVSKTGTQMASNVPSSLDITF
jgi:hypothetical protein